MVDKKVYVPYHARTMANTPLESLDKDRLKENLSHRVKGGFGAFWVAGSRPTEPPPVRPIILTGGIPDPKGRINKCFDQMLNTINKKCANLDVFPGCPSPAAADDLVLCIDEMSECEVCRALNEIDVLSRDCDEFDDGIANGSCPDISLCGPCTSDSQCRVDLVCNAGDICLQSCQCPLCAVCAGNCL